MVFTIVALALAGIGFGVGLTQAVYDARPPIDLRTAKGSCIVKAATVPQDGWFEIMVTHEHADGALTYMSSGGCAASEKDWQAALESVQMNWPKRWVNEVEVRVKISPRPERPSWMGVTPLRNHRCIDGQHVHDGVAFK